eukprot:1158402-Pelagomonas_calceolata.AAC.22
MVIGWDVECAHLSKRGVDSEAHDGRAPMQRSACFSLDPSESEWLPCLRIAMLIDKQAICGQTTPQSAPSVTAGVSAGNSRVEALEVLVGQLQASASASRHLVFMMERGGTGKGLVRPPTAGLFAPVFHHAFFMFGVEQPTDGLDLLSPDSYPQTHPARSCCPSQDG